MAVRRRGSTQRRRNRLRRRRRRTSGSSRRRRLYKGIDDFDRIHRTIREFDEDLIAIWMSLGDRFDEEISRAALAGLVQNRRDAQIAEIFNKVYASIEPELATSLRDAQIEAARVAASTLNLDLSFGLLNPRAALLARTRAGTLITEITPDTLKTIRTVLFRGALQGASVDDVARELRQVVGLHERFANAVVNRRTKLLARGLEEARVDREVSQYSNRLLRTRARTIARHELLWAANRGQREAWNVAADTGELDVVGVEREWIAALDDRTDPICQSLDGLRVPFRAEFPTGDPPAHVLCRCATGLIIP